MNELELIDGMSERLEKIFTGYTLLNKKGIPQSVRIFKQYLPQPKGLTLSTRKTGIEHYESEDYESNFPCIIIQMKDRTDKEEKTLDMSRSGMKLIVGVFDEELAQDEAMRDAGLEVDRKSYTCQSYRDILNMITMIRDDLLTERIIKGRFRIEMPLKSKLIEADTWPVYFGEMDIMIESGRALGNKDFVYRRIIDNGRRIYDAYSEEH